MTQAAGTTLNATTLVVPEHLEHGGAEHVGFNSPGVWVALSMLVVIGILLWKKVPAVIGAALDRQIASIKEQLDEASKLRAEAEAIKAEYTAKTSSASADAKSIVDHAHAEAAAIVAKAKADAETLIERRSRLAEEKIAATERAAVAELRAKAAGLAAAAAAKLIADKHGADADKGLVDKTIAGLGQRLN